MSFPFVWDLLKGPIYERDQGKKRIRILEATRQVAAYHYNNCAPYRKFCQKKGWDPSSAKNMEDFPFLPTSIFKDILLLSIPAEDVFREIRSSATTTGRQSRIGLDKDNNRRWSYSLQRMLLERIGNRRYRTLVLDDESALGQSSVVPARASMTRSLLFSAEEVATCLVAKNDTIELDFDKVEEFFSISDDGTGVMLFGFTYILYVHVILPMLEKGKTFNLPEIKVIHAGGWKKLESRKVTPEQLIADCCYCFGTKPENVIDIYGFSEQGGLLYPTCEYGARHTPAWSEVICRDPLTFESLDRGKEGLMQFITPIQTSYPGYSILTEDLGYIIDRDECPCGRAGTAFNVIGRSQSATEERGCGDIMADLFA